jgi:hypothetical protein
MDTLRALGWWLIEPDVLFVALPLLAVWARAAGGPHWLWRRWAPGAAAVLWSEHAFALAHPGVWQLRAGWWPAVPVLATALVLQLLAVARVRPALLAPPAVATFFCLGWLGLVRIIY